MKSKGRILLEQMSAEERAKTKAEVKKMVKAMLYPKMTRQMMRNLKKARAGQFPQRPFSNDITAYLESVSKHNISPLGLSFIGG